MACDFCQHISTHGGRTLRSFRIVAGLPAIFLTLASLGCGINNVTQPSAVVIATTSNPLVAQYSFQAFQAGLTAWVEFGTDTNYGRQTSVMQDSSTTDKPHTVSILVAGMLPQTTYHMRAHVDWLGGSWVDQDRTFLTGALPTDPPIPQFTVTGGAPGSLTVPRPGVELLSLVNTSGAKIMQAV